jgi:hypothetical protein
MLLPSGNSIFCLNQEMNSLEETSLSFIVRIWIEPREEGFTDLVWRGSIQDVMSGVCYYIDTLEQVTEHITNWIASMSVNRK